MSAPPKFATLPDAIAAYREGRSRRWAEVDGHQVDLHAAAHPCAVSRPHEPQREKAWSPVTSPIARASREAWDAAVALNIAAELARAVEVLPELAVPSEATRDVECCRECGRPMIGEVGTTVTKDKP